MPISALGVAVICSTPTTSAMRARPDSMVLMAPCTAAVPVAQAFSTRVAGLKRNASLACRTSDGGEILRREAGIEMSEHDLVHGFRADPGMGERLAGDAHDQAFDGLAVEPAKGRVSPADDAGGHDAPFRSWLMIVNRSGDADKPPPLEHARRSEGHMLSLLKSITFMRFD